MGMHSRNDNNPLNYLLDRIEVDDNGCWIWQLRLDQQGYGKATWFNKNCSAHRLALFAINGEWPEIACHTCDVKACCNPEHLYAGDRVSNAKDRYARGPNNSPIEGRGNNIIGSNGPIAMFKLWELGWTQQEIADLFEVTNPTVCRAIKREQLRH